MKNTILRIAIVLFVLALSNTLHGQKGDYNKAIKANSIEGYMSFLQKHPKSDYSVEIKEKLVSLEFGYVVGLGEIFSQKKSKATTSEQIELLNKEIRNYEKFIERYPNSKYQEQLSTKMKELDAVKRELEELKMQEESEKFAKEQEKINKMINGFESYKVDTTLEREFWTDGWNFLDPFYNKLGVTIFKREGNKLYLYLGYCSQNYQNSMIAPEGIANSFKKEFERGVGELTRNDVLNKYCFIFENGVLKSKEKL